MMFNWWSWYFDIQANRIRNALAHVSDGSGLLGRDADRGAAMRDNETGNGQIIDLETHRLRRADRVRPAVGCTYLRNREVKPWKTF